MTTSVSKPQSQPKRISAEALMQSMGAGPGDWDTIPSDQIKSFLAPPYEPATRVLAWVRLHTICFPYLKPYCVDEHGHQLRRRDCAAELNLDESTVSRQMRAWERRGLIRLDEDGRIWLCGKVPPVDIETGEHGDLPASVRQALETLETSARQNLTEKYLAWKDRRRKETAAMGGRFATFGRAGI
jgi:DNA-binding transcriptional ArsR family regulator